MEVINTQFVYQPPDGAAKPTAVGARLANLGSGRLICTFMLQSVLGVNDFLPVCCYSEDEGETWSEPKPLWPDLAERYSIFASISRQPDKKGRLMMFGVRTPIDTPGETFWKSESHAMKQNELIYALSDDGGESWQAPQPIPMPVAGAAEAPGAMCVTRDGHWLASYSPCNSFAPDTQAPHQQLMFISSADEGATWQSTASMTFDEEADGTAESWVIEIDDGRFLTACWHKNRARDIDYPNPFALSNDHGRSWTPSSPIGVHGQSLALTPLSNNRFLVVYNQRRQRPAGVRMALAQVVGDAVKVLADDLVWQAEVTLSGEAGGNDESIDNWMNFAFGEPCVLELSNNKALVVLWSTQPGGEGIVSVKADLPDV